jgi:ABC-type antimicrobial peptide transport system permease subunit
VVVINEAFARRFFPNQDPLGKHFGALAKFANAFEIVGIAADAKYGRPDRPVFPMYFVPQPQVTPYDEAGTMAFESRSLFMQDVVLRFTGSAGPLEVPIRRVFGVIDPNLTVITIRSFEAATIGQFSQETLIVRLTSLFGLTALLLASIGLYGVTSFAVTRRSREIGIRVALGADRQSVVKMVLRSAYVLVGIGLGFGLPLAVAMGRLVGSRLYGTTWYSPPILAAAATLIALCALAATIVPARRAASLDPVKTLRSD